MIVQYPMADGPGTKHLTPKVRLRTDAVRTPCGHDCRDAWAGLTAARNGHPTRCLLTQYAWKSGPVMTKTESARFVHLARETGLACGI
jgi:hypothetical protein